MKLIHVTVFLLLVVFGPVSAQHAQYKIQIIDSLLITTEMTRGKKVQLIRKCKDEFLIFFSDTAAFCIFTKSDYPKLKWQGLNTCEPLVPDYAFNDENQCIFQELTTRYLAFTTTLNLADCISLTRLQAKDKSGFLHNLELIRVSGDSLFFRANPNSMGPPDKNKISAYQKHYSKCKLVNVYDRSGKFLTSFGDFDSIFYKPGLQWASHYQYTTYSASRGEFLFGNMLTPKIKRYAADLTFLGEFGESTPGYFKSFPKILSREDAMVQGFRNELETMTFKWILEDDISGKIIRPYCAPIKDTTKLDRDFVRELLGKPKQKEQRCMAPDPSEKIQLTMLKSRQMGFQVYDLVTLNYEGVFRSDFSFGSFAILRAKDNGCQLAVNYANGNATILWWKLEETLDSNHHSVFDNQ